jgi:hypothetical protein
MTMMISDAIQMYGARGLYLRGLTDSALSERLVHWMNNCTQLSSTGMVDLCATENPDFFHRLIDVLAETALRNGDISSMSKAQDKEMWSPENNVMIKPSEQASADIKEIQNVISSKNKSLLIRFGSRKYMRELYENGGLLFQEASTFRKEENLSVRDDELTLLMKRYVPRDELKLIPGAPDQKTVEGRGLGLNFSLSCADFLVLCMTDQINFRLGSDWNAEAAVVIHDPAEFVGRLECASGGLVERAGGDALEFGRVKYIDPYFPLDSPDVPFFKHYKFAYQREFRVVLRGKRKVELSGRKLNVGSMADIADLVEFAP